MRYPITLEGFDGQTIEIQPTSLWSGPKLLVNGQPAAKGAKRGQVILTNNSGQEVVATWQPRFLGLDIPALVVNEKTIEVTKPLPWYAWLWSGLPLALLFVGGVLGVILGIAAFTVNANLFRSPRSTPVKFLLTTLVSLLAGAAYAVLAMLASMALGEV
jgi:hypothetical protein